MESNYLTTNDAASYLRLATGTLENWRCAGGGSAFLKLGAKVVYSRNDLDAWATAQRRESTNGAGARRGQS